MNMDAYHLQECFGVKSMLVSCFKMALKIFYDSTVVWGVMCGGVGVERCLSDEFGGLVGNKIKF